MEIPQVPATPIIVVIDTDLTYRLVPVQAGNIDLPVLRRELRCQWVELIRIGIPGIDVWGDDEGRINDKPANPQGTVAMAALSGIPLEQWSQCLYGPLVLCGNDNGGEDTTGLPEHTLAPIVALLDHLNMTQTYAKSTAN